MFSSNRRELDVSSAKRARELEVMSLQIAMVEV